MKTMLYAVGYLALCAVLLVLIGIFYVVPVVTYQIIREKFFPTPTRLATSRTRYDD